MQLKNSKSQFGGLTKLLHWSIFLFMCTQFYLAYARDFFEEGAPEKIQYIMLHKSIGVLILILGLSMVAWRHLGQRPSYPRDVAPWEKYLSKITHLLLYLLLFGMALSGMLMSMLSGYGVKFFGWGLPNFFEVNKPLAGIFHDTHELLAWGLTFFVTLHVLAALFHHFIRKDNILKRMLPFVKNDTAEPL